MPVLYHRTYKRDESADWVVFVHGAGGSSSIWFKQLRDFRAHFNVCMVDLRGHGSSSAVTGGTYSFEALSADILDVLDHLGIERAHFVGVSLGTILIRALAEQAPERVQAIVQAGAITRLDTRSRFLVSVGNALKRVMPFMWLYRLFAWIIMPRPHHREARDLFVEEAQNLSQDEFLRWFELTDAVNPLLRHFRENELYIPTLYVMGEQDHLFLPPTRDLVRRHALGTLFVIPDTGHVCNVERPSVFNRVAINFLERHGSGATHGAAGPARADAALPS